MVYIDTETTGLYIGDEIVEIAIINDDEVLLNSLVKPVNHTCWPDAQEIHGISPEMVADAPSYDDLRDRIRELVKGQDVVIYNAGYDSQYLHKELEAAASVNCAMEDFAELYGEWNDYHQSYTWQKLTTAAHYVRHEWTGEAHRALADTLATRSVWKYMTDPKEKKRVKAIKKQEALERKQKAMEREAVRLLAEIESDLKKEETERKKKRQNRILNAIYRWLSPTCYPKVKPDWKEHKEKEYFYYRLLTGLNCRSSDLT